jgi:thiol-disulfide isomerase/thioredoxin
MRKITTLLILALLVFGFCFSTLSCGTKKPVDGETPGDGTTGKAHIIPIEQAKDVGTWELPIVANPGDYGIQDKVKIDDLIKRSDVKLVIVDFWATWCEPCKAEMPHLQKIYAKYKDQGLAALVITIDSNKQLEPMILKNVAKLGVTYPIPWDLKSEVKAFYGINSIPVTYLIDKNGKIRYEHSGFTLEDVANLEESVKELLK